MNIANIPAGRYVVAVSGGVDSVVLLDALAQRPELELIVAHFDHGIRADSANDAAFVCHLAQQYKLAYSSGRAELGPQASEATARQARYTFLRQVCTRFGATLVTAHHQDDVLETAVINLLRGTGWRGLSSLRDLPTIRRPLLSVPKREITAYARRHALQWREDSTNNDMRYLRNRVRKEVLPLTTAQWQQELLSIIARQTEIRTQADALLKKLSCTAGPKEDIILRRTWLICLPANVQAEIIRSAVEGVSGEGVERHKLIRARWFIATAQLYKTLQISKTTELQVQKSTVVVRARSI